MRVYSYLAGMSFANPAFLWALAALAVPVVVHLFSFRKTQRVYFSSNRFLHQVQQATASRQKLKHLLLLASRLLFIFFLVMAFAQPFIPAGEQVTDTRSVTVYVDNSLSMSVPVTEKERALDAAIQHARQLAEVFPPDTRYRLLTNDFAPFSNSFKTKADFLNLLSGIRLSYVSVSLPEMAMRLQSGSPAGDFYLLSDFQKTTFGATEGLFTDTTRNVYLIQFQLKSHSNVYVDSAWLDNPFMIQSERNALHVRLRNTGQRPVSQLAVKLLTNQVQAGIQTLTVPAAGSAEVVFNLPAGLPRFARAEVRISDYSAVFDNQFYLALNRIERIQVAEIRDAAASYYIEKVFGNRQLFRFQSLTAANVNYATIQSADLVVLNEVNTLDAVLTEALRSYILAGGSLLVVPGSKPATTAVSQLAGRPVDVVDDDEKLEVQPPDFGHPFFRYIVEEPNSRLTLFSTRRVMSWGNDRAALLKLKNGMPLLSVFRRGNGKVFLFAAPLQPDYTDFGNHFLFLPVMYRMALSGKKTILKPYYSLIESQIQLRTDSAGTPALIRLEGERAFIPDQQVTGDRVVLQLPGHLRSAGFFYAIRQTDTLALLAFNTDKRESELEQHTEQSLKEALGNRPNIRWISGVNSGKFGTALRAHYLGTPLWRYALLLALLFLLTEILLVRYWR